jgi:hypothetical protein
MNKSVCATPRITPFNSSEGHLGSLVNVGGATTSTLALRRIFPGPSSARLLGEALVGVGPIRVVPGLGTTTVLEK